MHALSKKHYYDVRKSGQQSTILESDTSNEDCEREDTTTLEVGCYARAHLKSNSVQTQWSRNNKNFRNEYTVTSDEEIGAVTRDCPIYRECSIHHSRSYEDVATVHSRSNQATGASNQQRPLQKNGAKFCQLQKIGFALESRDIMTAKTDDESTQCECMQSNSDEHHYIPSNKGLAACRTFSLGSPESRRFQNEHCNTKLIGGCRVPVRNNCKSRF